MGLLKKNKGDTDGSEEEASVEIEVTETVETEMEARDGHEIERQAWSF